MDLVLSVENFLRILVLSTILNSGNKVKGIFFNSSGYEHCVFNVVEYTYPKVSHDLIDRVLVKSHGILRWTINQADPTHQPPGGADLDFGKPLRNPTYLKQNCSVNIILVTGNCFIKFLIRILLSFVISEENMLFLILPIGTECSRVEMPYSYYPYNFYYNILLTKHFEVSSAYSLCAPCDNRFKLVHLKYNPSSILPSLYELQKFSSRVKILSLERYIAVGSPSSGLKPDSEPGQHARSNPNKGKFLYRKTGTTPIHLIITSRHHIFMEDAAVALNMSLKYVTYEEDNRFYFFSAPKHYSAIALLAVCQLDDPFLNVLTHRLSLIVINSYLNKFLYCVDKDEHESFSFLFWTVPFDFWSWTGLALSSLSFSIFIRGELFQIYSILMRQFCTILNKNKILIVISLVAIIFTHGYEGVISSFLTVPPPIKVAERLKDLIELGYKILYYQGFSPELRRVFEQESITVPIEGCRVPGSESWSTNQIHGSIAQRKTTTEVITREQQGSIDFMATKYRDTKCHIVKNTFLFKHEVYIFRGHLEKKLLSISQNMLQGGILEFIYDYCRFVNTLSNLDVMRARIKMEEESRTIPFVMRDWKLLSIFIVWIFLLGIAFMVLLIEVVFSYTTLKQHLEHSAILWAFKRIAQTPLVIFTAFRKLWRTFKFQMPRCFLHWTWKKLELDKPIIITIERC